MSEPLRARRLLRDFIRSWFTRPDRRMRPRAAVRLGFDCLEERLTPSTTIWTVTSTAGGIAQSGPNAGTLAYCVQQADLDTSGSEDITFNSGVSGTITLSTPLTLSNTLESMTIDGSGASGTITVSGGGTVGVFVVQSGVTATINDLTITGGSANAAGGGIGNAGTLTVSDCTITGNTSYGGTGSGGAGGGIANTGSLTVSNSIISSNVAKEVGGLAVGGGIDVISGSATVTGSTISSNSLSADYGTWNAGGIYVGPTGTLWLNNSTITSNSGASVGGGLDNDGTVTATGCSFLHNSASIGGGLNNNSMITIADCTFLGNSGTGIVNSAGTMRLNNSTVTDNNTVGITGTIGGIVTVFDSIIGGNNLDYSTDIEAAGSFSVTYSAVGTVTGTLQGGGLGDIYPTNFGTVLGSIANYGGSTDTIPLPQGSPALGTGSLAGAPATDQRGMPRIVNGAIDMGAFENQMVLTSANQFAAEGALTSIALGTLTDAGATGASSWVANVNWGDSTTQPPFSTPLGNISHTHTYAATGTYTVTVSVTDFDASGDPLGDVGSDTFTVTVQQVATPTFLSQPNSTGAGITLNALTVQVLDTSGIAVPNAPVSMTISAPGTLSGTTVATTNSSGDAVFSTLSVDEIGTYTLVATVAGLSKGSNSFVISAGAPSKVTFATQPSAQTAGIALSPVSVEVVDAFGNVLTGFSVSVALTAGSFASGTTSVSTNASGQAVFSNLVEDQVGTYTLSATVAGLASVLSNPFIITSAAPATLTFVTSPSNTIAGSAINPVTVSVADAYGNPVSGVAISVSIAPGSLTGGSTTTVTSSAGQAVFSNLVEDTAGTYALTASATGATPKTSGTFIISAATANKLAFATQPLNAGAGATLSPITVQVTDNFGNPVAGNTVSISLAPGSLSSGTTSIVANSSGDAVFSNLVEDTLGTYSLTASATGLAAVTSDPFTISNAPPAKLTFLNEPANAVAGSVLNAVTVQVTDSLGNIAPNTVVGIALSLGSFTSGTTSMTSNAAGDVIFNNLLVDTAGTYTLTASSSGVPNAASNSFTISAQVATETLSFLSQPQGTTAGSTLSAVTVKVADQFGNGVAGVSIGVTLSPNPFTSGGTPQVTNASGQAVFGSLVEDLAGTYTLTASATGVSSLASNSFIITPSPTTTALSFASQPSNGIAGSPINAVTVKVADNFGNAVAGLPISISIAPGTLTSGTTSLTSNAQGQVIFSNLVEDTAGTYTLTASAVGVTNIASSPFTITAQISTETLSFLSQPQGTTAGSTLSAVTVKAADQFGNGVASVSIGVSLSPNPLTSGSTPQVTNASGQAVFSNLVEDLAGTYTLTASAAGVSSLASNPFIITPSATTTALAFVSQPSNTIAGSTINAVTVKVADNFGNAVAGLPIGISIAPGTLTSGTTSLTSNAQGLAIFSNLVEDTAGVYTLTASAAGVANITSSPFTITAQVSTEALSFLSQPSSTTAGSTLTAVTVKAADQFGNVFAGVSISVTLSPHPLSAGSTPQVTNALGQTVFSNLVEDLAGTYTLTAAAGASSILSNSFVITPLAATVALTYVSQPSNTIAGSAINPVTVQIADKFGNVLTGVAISIGIAPNALTSGTTPLTSNAAGQVVFGDLLENKAGTYSLTASSTGLTSVPSSSFVVSPAAASASLSFSGQPNATTAAGTILGNVIVQALDPFGNVVPGIVVGIALAPGTLNSGTTPLTTNSSGQADFNDLIENVAGSYSLTASAGGLGSSSSNPFTVTAAAARLSFITQPSTTTAGTLFNTVIVQVADIFGNVVSGVVVSIASSPRALSTGTTPLTTGVSGQAAFADLAQEMAGTYSLTAFASGYVSIVSQSFIITSAAAQTLTFVNQPSSITAGSALNAITLAAADTFGNPVVDGSVSVALSAGTLNGATSVLTNASGQAVFSTLAIATGGLFTLQATSGSAYAVSNPFAVTSSADRFTWIVQPSGTIAGVALNAVTVALSDPLGDLLPGVKISVALSAGSLASGAATAATNSSGQATFSGLTVNTAGTYTLLASAPAVSPAPSSSFVIKSANVSKFIYLNQPSNTVAGAVMSPVTVKAVDQYGNLVPGLPVTIASTYGTLAGTRLATTSAGGLAVFSGLSESVAGTAMLSVAVTSASGDSSPFLVTAAAASTISFLSQPASTQAGMIITPVIVSVADKYGNPVAGTYVTLKVSLNTVAGSTVLATNSAGQAVFNNLEITKAGTYTFSVSDAGLIKATSNSFTIAAGAGNLSFMNEPAGTSAGSTLNSVTIRDLDQYGNPVAGAIISVRLSSGTLTGTLTLVTNSAGQAVFSTLKVPAKGTYTLIATVNGQTVSVASSTFIVS